MSAYRYRCTRKCPFPAENVRLFKEGDEVNVLTLLEKNLIRHKGLPVKILGNGKLNIKLTVKVHKISATAKDKILAAGGKVL